MSVRAVGAMPLSDMAPRTEKSSATAGAMPMASRGDHQHPRITSATKVTTDANGLATAMFAFPFAAEPNVIPVAKKAAGTAPVQLSYEPDFIMSAGQYVGVKIVAQRMKALPTGLVVITVLNGYQSWEPAAGVAVDVTALPQNSAT